MDPRLSPSSEDRREDDNARIARMTFLAMRKKVTPLLLLQGDTSHQ